MMFVIVWANSIITGDRHQVLRLSSGSDQIVCCLSNTKRTLINRYKNI